MRNKTDPFTRAKLRKNLISNVLCRSQKPLEREFCSDVPEEGTESPTFCTKASTAREPMSVFTVNLHLAK